MKYNVLVREVMKKNVKCVAPDDRVEKAANIMKKEDIGSVLVMDKYNLVGILTTTDIVYKYVAGKSGKFVRDIMTKDVVRISPNITIEEAAMLLSKKKIKKLPVFDKGKLVGIITATDILKIEPALYEILLERMRIGSKQKIKREIDYGQCERCGNYTSDLIEIEGEQICEDCRDEDITEKDEE